jgi:hypothetical protein
MHFLKMSSFKKFVLFYNFALFKKLLFFQKFVLLQNFCFFKNLCFSELFRILAAFLMREAHTYYKKFLTGLNVLWSVILRIYISIDITLLPDCEPTVLFPWSNRFPGGQLPACLPLSVGLV